MSKLTQRSIKPAFFFGDGRLLGVSREARMLALTLECLADATGCVRNDALEIRAAVGFWLAADAQGDAPSLPEISSWVGELAAVTWVVEDGSQNPPVLYLKGFGDRQQSQYVYIGVNDHGELQPHLQTPCVAVQVENVTKKEGGKPAFRGFPVHCGKPFSACPCYVLTAGGPPESLQTTSGESSESGSESGSVSVSGKRVESNRIGARGNRSGSPRANLGKEQAALLEDFEGWHGAQFSGEEVRIFFQLCDEHGIETVRAGIKEAVKNGITSLRGLSGFVVRNPEP